MTAVLDRKLFDPEVRRRGFERWKAQQRQKPLEWGEFTMSIAAITPVPRDEPRRS